jgi:hypothetical protein
LIHQDPVNQLRQVTEQYTLKNFLDVNIVHMPWTQEKDERLLRDSQVVGPRWALPARRWETHSAIQLKNQWDRVPIMNPDEPTSLD